MSITKKKINCRFLKDIECRMSDMKPDANLEDNGNPEINAVSALLSPL
jgi:hypothetical protein